MMKVCLRNGSATRVRATSVSAQLMPATIRRRCSPMARHLESRRRSRPAAAAMTRSIARFSTPMETRAAAARARPVSSPAARLPRAALDRLVARPWSSGRSSRGGGTDTVLSAASSADRQQHRDLRQRVLAHLVVHLLVRAVDLDLSPRFFALACIETCRRPTEVVRRRLGDEARRAPRRGPSSPARSSRGGGSTRCARPPPCLPIASSTGTLASECSRTL